MSIFEIKASKTRWQKQQASVSAAIASKTQQHNEEQYRREKMQSLHVPIKFVRRDGVHSSSPRPNFSLNASCSAGVLCSARSLRKALHKSPQGIGFRITLGPLFCACSMRPPPPNACVGLRAARVRVRLSAAEPTDAKSSHQR